MHAFASGGDLCCAMVYVPGKTMSTTRERRGTDLVTRGIDVTGALVGLLFFAPLLILIALLVRFGSRGPILFGHQRIGHGGRTFTCYKFRSMVVDAEERLQELLKNDPQARCEWMRDHKLKRDPRTTPIGGFLRKSSLDELPQFFNVLLGEMSLVGPRPIVSGEIPRYGRYLQCYASVKPGLTGLWQISGRNNTSYRRRVAMDVAYARAKSVRLDLRILVATVPAVIGARGSY